MFAASACCVPVIHPVGLGLTHHSDFIAMQGDKTERYVPLITFFEVPAIYFLAVAIERVDRLRDVHLASVKQQDTVHQSPAAAPAGAAPVDESGDGRDAVGAARASSTISAHHPHVDPQAHIDGLLPQDHHGEYTYRDLLVDLELGFHHNFSHWDKGWYVAAEPFLSAANMRQQLIMTRVWSTLGISRC